MFSQIKNKLQLISGFLLLIFSTYYLSKDNSLLGFFADDGNTLYILLKNITFFELIDISIKWDAARDLHLIWQKFFILISFGDKISGIRFYQVIFYIINVILFCYILKKLKFSNEIILIISIASIFFPSYSEVVLWIHAFTMVLISTLFFLIFTIFQIHILNEKNISKSIKLNFFSAIFLILAWFTYEQSVFVSFFIVAIVNFIKLQKKLVSKKFFQINILLYSFLVIAFSLFKLNSAGVFNPNIIKYQPGSNIVFDYQILKNILIGFAVNIREFIIFEKHLIKNINIFEVLFFNILYGSVFYLILTKKKNKKLNLFETYRNIFIFFILFVASMFPLYFHYISDRHNYLPSFFMFTGIAYFLKYFFNKDSNFFLNFFLILFIFYCANNFLIKYNFKKYQLIENYEIKNNFYNDLLKSEKIELSREKIFLKNFPPLRYGEVFFAHEPAVNFKLITNNNSLPFLSLKNDYKKGDLLITFDKIKNDNLIYKISIIN